MYGAGSTAVVTGAAGGIGEAIAERLAAEGFRLVLTDLSPRVEQVAGRLGVGAVVGDVASPDGVDAVIDAALEQLGRIDLFVGNAGVDVGRGLETPDEQWRTAYDVNVMAHVRAARRLVPLWLDGGGGRYVVTASAAGLLTMLGNAPYSVTKHGAVAFAEWLRATYGHRGVVVQAICPQGVRTRMLEESGPLKDLLSRDRALEPAEVADALWAALQGDRFLVLPHPEVAGYYAFRAGDTDAWLAGMQRLQGKVDALTAQEVAR